MENYGQNLKKRVMRRVYAIWFFREMVPLLIIAPSSLGFTLWLTAREFFVTKIVENFTLSLHSGSILAITDFIGSALYKTRSHIIPLLIISFSTGLFLFLAYRIMRNITSCLLVKIYK